MAGYKEYGSCRVGVQGRYTCPETVHAGELTVIGFPITDLFEESLYLVWLECHLHLTGFVCPRSRSANRRLFRRQGYYGDYRCRVCDGYYTLLSGTTLKGAGSALRCYSRERKY